MQRSIAWFASHAPRRGEGEAASAAPARVGERRERRAEASRRRSSRPDRRGQTPSGRLATYMTPGGVGPYDPIAGRTGGSMRRSSRRAVAALAIVAGLGALTAGCGSPLSTADVTDTAQAGAGAPTGTPATVTAVVATETPRAPDATATALFDAVNRKLALNDEPTLAPGTDLDNPHPVTTPSATYTPGPSPTPLAPGCGATISGWGAILTMYGELTKGSGCGPIGSQLVVLTNGIDGGPGAIATYQCEASDTNCLRGNSPQAPNAAWSVYPAPFPGGVAYLANGSSPDIMLLAGGHCFNLTTHTYDIDCN